MHTIRMPKAARTTTEGTVGCWHKNPGQAVRKGDVLVEIETPEAMVELESAADGVLLKVLAAEGTVLPVGSPLALVGAKGEDVSAAMEALTAEGKPAAPKPAPVKPPAQTSDPVPTAPPAGKVIPVLMPQAGQSMEEGTILEWKVQPGDAVQTGQILFEVETDKATIEIEAADAGRLARIVVPEGETVPVKTPVAYLADHDADVDAYLSAHGGLTAEPVPAQPTAETAPESAAASAEPAPQTVATAPSGRVKASPAARRLAAQRGIELSTVGAGSGPAGRILSTDLPAAAPASLQAPTVRPAAIRTGPVGQPTRRKLAGMRKAIAKNLTASKQNIPHFYLRGTIDAGALFDTYRRAKAHFKCSVNDFLLAAVARVMGEFPAFRTRLEGEELVEYPTSNVGIAVGLDKGLVVPVLLGADRMALPQLAATTRQIVEAARGGKIEAMGQGNLTITNLGMFGTEEFSAIINPPEAAILAVGAIREAVLVKDGAMRPGRVMTMTLSCDHRVIDGMQAAQFMARLKEVLESPQMLV